MFRHSDIQFKENTVLKSEMLQESVDYAREMLQHIYNGYSDGIIEGVDIEIIDNFLIINPGIVKYQGRIYHMFQPTQIPYMQTNKCTYLRIRFGDRMEKDAGIQYTSEIILTEDETIFPYEMELGRFIPERGARQYADYDDFEDIGILRNRLDIRYVPYAGRGESTISPKITTLFAREMMKKDMENPYDIAFVMQCLSKAPIEREVICAYLHKKEIDIGDCCDNKQIYDALLQILRDSPRNERQVNRQPHRIIVI